MIGEMQVWLNYLREEKEVFSVSVSRSWLKFLLGLGFVGVGTLAVIIYGPYIAELPFGFLLGLFIMLFGLLVSGYGYIGMIFSQKRVKTIDLLLSMITSKQLTTGEQVSATYDAWMSKIRTYPKRRTPKADAPWLEE